MLTELDIVKAVQKFGPDIIENCLFQDSFENYIKTIDKEKLDYPFPKEKINYNNWFIPNSYKEMNIEEFLINICPPENLERLKIEISLFEKNNMIIVLKAMKYLVDTLRKNNIVWGVGRGSSVASYALFLIGVHKIDSVKYNLPITEFFKGEKHGQAI